MYYEAKIEALRDVFGAEVALEGDRLLTNGRAYPIVDDVIVLLEPSEYPRRLRERLAQPRRQPVPPAVPFEERIQFSFGEEWAAFPHILPEHEAEFEDYFDLVDFDCIRSARVCDLGCGIGRWSYFLSSRCREVILVDFSDAIFVARRNLADVDNALFFMADITRLPFRDDFADLVVCLGVLHHLPVPALAAARRLARMAPKHLIYIYYALENRPWYFRSLLGMTTWVRLIVSGVRSPHFRLAFTWLVTLGLYVPMLALGQLLNIFARGRDVPLYEAYRGKSLRRIRQDVYDRFFTGIEQRHTRRQIEELADTFSSVRISDGLPYWHFLCER